MNKINLPAPAGYYYEWKTDTGIHRSLRMDDQPGRPAAAIPFFTESQIFKIVLDLANPFPSDEDCLAIIRDLDAYGRAVDLNLYGLPLGQTDMAEMCDRIRKVVMKNQERPTIVPVHLPDLDLSKPSSS